MNKRLMFLIILAIGIFEVNVSPMARGTQNYTNEGIGDYIGHTLDIMDKNYDDTYSKKDLLNKTLKGMLESFDNYTTYLTNEEMKSMQEGLTGQYFGIGVIISNVGDNTVVTKVFQNSPSEKAGIIIDDMITSVNGVNTKKMKIEEVASLIKGLKGTKVKIGIVRTGNEKEIQFDIMRDEIKINPVLTKYFDDKKIGYLKLDSFNSNATDAVRLALKRFSNDNINNLIFDIRDNPGGELSTAIDIAQELMSESLITKVEFKSEAYQDIEYRSHINNKKFKLVLLVNNNSASASEILAGAIKDTNSGVLIGTKTYGKGKVQNFIPVMTPQKYEKLQAINPKVTINISELDLVNQNNFEDSDIQGWIKLTVGHYLTPSGKNIDKIGIRPNIYVRNSDDDSKDIMPLENKVIYRLNDSALDIFNAERMLNAFGYTQKNADYMFDEETFKALKKFQEENNLKTSGDLDFDTQNMLNNKYEKDYLTIDKQLKEAIDYFKK